VRPARLSIDGCKGMRRPNDLKQFDPAYAYTIVDGYPADPINGGDVVERPAWTIHGTELGTASLGVPNITNLIYQFNKSDGTSVTMCITSGKLYTFDWSNNTWTESVTAANFTTASITTSATARCSAVTLNDVVVVSDGTNTPWSWDGTSGAGGLTKLTNCPVLYGPPQVYYGKVFGVKNTERTTLVWSEENDPATGYEAGGYNNSWTLSQTTADPLFSVLATNEALYYFRLNSIGRIEGAVTPDFSTSGVRDSVAEGTGTVYPWGVTIAHDRVWFLDQFCRPQSFQVGGKELFPLYESLGAVYTGAAHPDLTSTTYPDTIPGAYDLPRFAGAYSAKDITVVPYPRLNAVVFAQSEKIYLYGVDTGDCLGYWTSESDGGGGGSIYGLLSNVGLTGTNMYEQQVLIQGTYQGNMYFLGEAASSYGSGVTFVVEHGPVMHTPNMWAVADTTSLRYRGTDTGTGTIGCTGSEATAANTQAVTFVSHGSGKMGGRMTLGWDQQGRYFILKVTNASKTGNIVWRGWDMTGFVGPMDTAEV